MTNIRVFRKQTFYFDNGNGLILVLNIMKTSGLVMLYKKTTLNIVLLIIVAPRTSDYWA